MAITGKPLGATAGAMMFAKGGNAVDATAAMLAAVTTMWDVLGWGGETQALIYHPEAQEGHRHQRAGRGAHRSHAGVLSLQGIQVPARVRPAGRGHARHARGLMTMLAEYGTLSLAEVLAPAIQMADGYPIEAQTAEPDRERQGQASSSGSTRRR